MNEKNGYVRWWHLVTAFVSLLGILVSVGLYGLSAGIDIDKRALANYKDNRSAVIELMKENSSAHEKIMTDIAEIKSDLRYIVRATVAKNNP